MHQNTPTREEVLQSLIDSGLAWHRGAEVAREVHAAIVAGDVMLGDYPDLDAEGRPVAAWWTVEPGSCGSPEYAGRQRPPEPDLDEQLAMLQRMEKRKNSFDRLEQQLQQLDAERP